MITAADVKVLRNQVEKAIESLEPTLVVSDDDHSSARKLIYELPDVLSDIAKGVLPSAEHIARAAITACKDIQFRDYLMGLFTEFDTKLVGGYLEIINNSVVAEYAYPATTVLATYYFRDGDKETAMNAVQEVLDRKPDYSLAKLLVRIFPIAGNDMFAQMAGELHPKVKANILEEGDNN